jgi:ferric iron reductase protein FhuF
VTILQSPILQRADAGSRKNTAHCFSTLAPEWLAPHLEHVWLGLPDEAQHTCGKTNNSAAESICIPLTELGGYRDELLNAMVGHYGGDPEIHARALLSQWSKYYFWLAAPAGIVALLLHRPLDMSPARTQLVLQGGMPTALYFSADALQPPETEAAGCFASLVDHLQAVIETLAGMTRIAPRVLWSNAGNLLDYLVAESVAKNVAECTTECATDCATILGASCDLESLFRVSLIDGEPNPLRTPVRHVKPRSALLPNPFRARRVCCMRNEIPGEKNLCGSCPLLLTMRDEALALQESLR